MVWREADWQKECSVVGAAACGMHHSVAATSEAHTDSSQDDGCVPHPAAATAGLQHTATNTRGDFTLRISLFTESKD